jgi:hypothetical protein
MRVSVKKHPLKYDSTVDANRPYAISDYTMCVCVCEVDKFDLPREDYLRSGCLHSCGGCSYFTAVDILLDSAYVV